MTENATFDEVEFAQLYHAAQPDLFLLADRVWIEVVRATKQLADPTLVRTHRVDYRLKSPDSIAAKARRKGWTAIDALYRVPDLIGVRAVCANLEDVARVAELTREALARYAEDLEIEIHPGDKADAGYRATHVNGWIRGKTLARYGVEIQIRTVLQDAWATLTHRDIYKSGQDIPESLRELNLSLSEHVNVGDRIAQVIRHDLARAKAAPDHRPDLSTVTEDGIAFLFKLIFGRDPGAWVLSAFATACDEFGIDSLASVEAMLSNSEFRQRVRTAYRAVSGSELDAERLFLGAPLAVKRGIGAAATYVRRQARREYQEAARIGRAEMLADLPPTVDALAVELSEAEDDGSAIELVRYIADAVGALKTCAACNADIVDPGEFETAVYEHYRVGEPDGRLEEAVRSSGIEMGHVCTSGLCAYHGDLLSPDH